MSLPHAASCGFPRISPAVCNDRRGVAPGNSTLTTAAPVITFSIRNTKQKTENAMSPLVRRASESMGSGFVLAITVAVAGGLLLTTTGPSGEGVGSRLLSRSATVESGPLFITAAAHVSGAAETDWRTDLEIYNPGTQQAGYEISLLEKNQSNLSPATVGFSLVSGMAVRYDDILHSVFDFTGSAGLRITATNGEVVAISRTYNQTSLGTYGQFIGSDVEANAIEAGQEGRIIQLTHNRSNNTGYRTNVGFLNCTTETIAVRAELYTSDGDRLGTRSYDLEPLMFSQKDRIFEQVTDEDVDDGYVVVTTTTPGGRFFAYASVVDNRTGDPVYIPAVKLNGVESNEAVYVPAAAHVAGAAGTNWRTDLELHNPGATTVRYEIALLERNQSNSNPDTETYQVAGGHSLRLEDVLLTVFGATGGAALRITPIAGQVLVTSRTYNLTDDGTYGQFIGGVGESRAVGQQERGALIELSHHLTTDTGYRTNMGYVNCTPAAVDVRADLYKNDGTFLGTKNDTLQPYMHKQIDRVFGTVTTDEVRDGYIVVSTPDPGGRFFAYASVVDNSTGDPVCIPATPVDEAAPQPTPTPTPGPTSVIEPLEIVEWLFDWLGTVPGAGTVPDIEGAVAWIQTNGLDDLLQAIANQNPNIVSWTHHHLEVDYGNGYALADGTLLKGRISVDFPFVNSTSDQLNINYTGHTTGLEIDGRVPPIDDASGYFQVTVDSEGHAAGAWSISGTGGSGMAEFVNTVDGALGIDTATCLTYPMAGTITFELEDGVHTITVGPECDGTFTYTGPAGRTGDLAFRLRWAGIQDLDLHVREPSGEEIWFADRISTTGGVLDLDSNAACMSQALHPTENIYWPLGQAPQGSYEFWVVLYSDCAASPTPDYTLQVIEGETVVREIEGTIADATSPHYTHEY